MTTGYRQTIKPAWGAPAPVFFFPPRTLPAATFSFIALSLLAAALAATSAAAGPVARELQQRGAQVGVPDARPPLPIDVGASNPKTETPETEPKSAPAATPKNGAEATVKSPEQVAAPPPDSCLRDLLQIASASRAISPPAKDNACTISDPVILKATLGDQPVQFSKNLLLDCPFAKRLANFVRDTAQPLARYHIGQPLVGILSGQGFVCRRRNNAATGKLSEHALGNATDWIGFKFGGAKRLSIQSAKQMKPGEARFFNALRIAACGSFTTVLGPGSNPAHKTHLHLDLGRTKNGKKNPYRICE